MLLFDVKGHLTPYSLISTDWQTFVMTFGWNQHRLLLIDSLQNLVDELLALSIQPFDLWVDGSFVSQKDRPNDIDVVVFLTTEHYRAHEQVLRNLRDKFNWLDIYFVRVIDENERDYFLYVSDRAEWLFQFTTIRPEKRSLRKYPKGFLQLSWPYEQATESAYRGD